MSHLHYLIHRGRVTWSIFIGSVKRVVEPALDSNFSEVELGFLVELTKTPLSLWLHSSEFTGL